MTFDLDQRIAALSVGEFAGFSLGPRESGGGGAAGLWRAQLGTHWHNELRARAVDEHAAAAEFEIPITGRIVHRGWTLTLTGRIDQRIRTGGKTSLREIKTVTRPLPADEAELRADYPEYFIQLASYGALARLGALATEATLDAPAAPAPAILRTELVFVEVASGLAQTIELTPGDDGLFRAQLERISEFLSLRLRARERLRGLRFQPAFATPRQGQETTQAELTARFERQPLVLFEAPTGFGKTGVLLEFALGQLRSGHFDRALYLTSKSTGQLQVVRTLGLMTAAPASAVGKVESSKLKGERSETGIRPVLSTFNVQPSTSGTAPAVAAWHVRNKSEHCVNTTFHCVRDSCRYLADASTRWAQSGLARFYLDDQHARDLDTLRAAGRNALICPYEITRTALAFNDVWIGDYNYVFAPRNRGLFFEQPGFLAARTLLILDEAHNLPSRVADAYSHAFTALDAYAVRDELHRLRPLESLVTAWDHWCHFLHHLRSTDTLTPADEDDARHLLGEVAARVRSVPLDLAALGPRAADALWSVPALIDDLAASTLTRLWWCPRDSELALTCLDAAPAIGATLREFGGVVLASATLTPVDGFTAACGLDAPPEVAPPAQPPAPDRLGALTKRDTRKLYQQLTRGSELLRVEEARSAASPALLQAHTPWRDGSYDVAFDTRVDTTFQHRSHHYTTTAATIATLRAAAIRALNAQPSALNAAATACVAVFFPSYAYAEAISRELATVAPALRVALQPKLRDLAAQSVWVDESLRQADAVFLVLGSSFAESIDALGGRVTHAMVVGPALPEVNAVQRARLAEAARAGLTREAAFRRVYQIPGMTKVNQALGRLVRAPGQRARVVLHCRRFLDPHYRELLASEYRQGSTVSDDAMFAAWLGD
ncbi:helicase C-terminal domain-containing protein [Horticoccus sp. 23ND18S-11]|uniref:helicase C-terminal domain-containing protein n=1 Tax=Horticoccus sp. 23ND18S-11 TaxID=3391832 RepID=UPI0039C9E963